MTHSRPLVIVTQTKERPVHMETVHKHLDELADIKTIDHPFYPLKPQDEDRLIEQFKDATGLFMRTGNLTRRVIEGMPNLGIIAVHGAGLDQVDLEACTERGIYVTNAPGGNANAVAEYIFGLLLALIRRIVRGDRMVREDRWQEAIFNGFELQGKVIGIVGLGYVGTKVARIARGFNMFVIGYDPYVALDKFRNAGVVPVSLQSLLREADVVTLHVPITDATRHMIGTEEFGLMKRTAVFVNAARGACVDETALYEALKGGRISGAALDAFEVEPIPSDSPLLELENVVVSPHMAGVAYEVLPPIADMACGDIAKFLNGESPHFIGNKKVLAVRARLGLEA
jgi:D-3-phosphoglycerate dehydrogenase